MSWFPWWRRWEVRKNRLVVVGHDYQDAVRACEWLDLPRRSAISMQTAHHLNGYRGDTIIYLTGRCVESGGENLDALKTHLGLGGTVIHMTDWMYR